MPSLLICAVLAFVFSLAFTPAVRWAVNRFAWLRRPVVPAPLADLVPVVPRLGGLAVMAAAALSLYLRHILHWGIPNPEDIALSVQLFPALGLILLIGVLDDCLDLSPGLKFAGQILAACWVIAHGLRVTTLFYHQLPVWLSLGVTLLWLVGCTNAFNLIDGMDGLATGLALFATGTVLAHAVLIGEPGLALQMGVLFGALLGFLFFNFPPASIYLGDAGSLSIGFILGCMALAWANKATTVVGLLAPLFALLVPVLDTLVAILRRGMTGRPLFLGDRSHVHHRLQDRGLAPRQVIWVLYGVAGLGGIAALVLADVQRRQSFELVILLFVALAALGVQQLGYTEFSEVGRLFRRGMFDPRRALQAQVSLHQWADTLTRAADYDALCQGLSDLGRSLDFHGFEFQVGRSDAPHWRSRAVWTEIDPEAPGFCGWQCRIPLGADGGLGMVTYWRSLNPDHPGFVDDVAAVLRTSLAPRLEEMADGRPRARAAGAGGGVSS